MITTLRESKARLSALVQMAANGEEVVITVRGKPKARLCPMIPTTQSETRSQKTWGGILREARKKYSVGISDTAVDILDHLRGDRA